MRIGSAGFTIVELMIAMVVGLLLVGGAYGTFIGQQEAFTNQGEAVAVQQNLRFINQMLSREFRNAGYGMGGVSLGGTGTVDLNNARPIVVQDNNTAQTIALASGGPIAIDNNTDSFDILTTRLITTLGANAANATNPFTLNDASALAAGDLFMISNGASAHFFQVTSVAGNVVNHNAGLATFNLPGGQQDQTFPGYSAGDSVYHVFWYKYFVSGSALQRVPYNTLSYSGNNILPGPPQIVAQNIEDMQLAFGLDTDNTDNTLEINAWDNNGLAAAQLDQVRAVRVSFTARSARAIRSVTGRPATEFVLENHDPATDAGYNAADYIRFIRRTATNTVRVRNYGI